MGVFGNELAVRSMDARHDWWRVVVQDFVARQIGGNIGNIPASAAAIARKNTAPIPKSQPTRRKNIMFLFQTGS